MSFGKGLNVPFSTMHHRDVCRLQMLLGRKNLQYYRQILFDCNCDLRCVSSTFRLAYNPGAGFVSMDVLGSTGTSPGIKRTPK